MSFRLVPKWVTLNELERFLVLAFSERDTYVHVRYMLSAVRLSSVCRL